MRTFLLQGVEQPLIMDQGLFQKDANRTEMITLSVVLPTLIHQEVHLVQQEGELMLMKVTDSGMKGILPLLLLQVTVKVVLVIMTLFLVQNVPTLHWMMFLPVMLMRASANQGHG